MYAIEKKYKSKDFLNIKLLFHGTKLTDPKIIYEDCIFLLANYKNYNFTKKINIIILLENGGLDSRLSRYNCLCNFFCYKIYIFSINFNNHK